MEWLRLFRRIGILLVFLCVMVGFEYSWGLDLWNSDLAYGAPNPVYTETFPSLSIGAGIFPLTLTPHAFIRIFHLARAQKEGAWGRGQTILFFENSAAFDRTAFRRFERQNLVPAIHMPIVFQGGRPIKPTTNRFSLETMLDTEWTTVIAPQARLLVINIHGNTAAQIRRIVDRYHVTNVVYTVDTEHLSIPQRTPLTHSLGYMTPSLVSWLTKHATVWAASGDVGSFINPLAYNPRVVMVGGMQLKPYALHLHRRNAQVWGSESTGRAVGDAWASTRQRREGKFVLWRQIPDVVWLSGFPGVWMRRSVGWQIAYGTSVAAPCWAALWALANQAHEQVWHRALPVSALPLLYRAALTRGAFLLPVSHRTPWVPGWGLGFPNPSALVPLLAHAVPRLRHVITGVPPTQAPFWVALCGLLALWIPWNARVWRFRGWKRMKAIMKRESVAGGVVLGTRAITGLVMAMPVGLLRWSVWIVSLASVAVVLWSVLASWFPEPSDQPRE